MMTEQQLGEAWLKMARAEGHRQKFPPSHEDVLRKRENASKGKKAKRSACAGKVRDFFSANPAAADVYHIADATGLSARQVRDAMRDMCDRGEYIRVGDKPAEWEPAK